CYQQLELSGHCNFAATLSKVTDTGIIVTAAWGQEIPLIHDGAILMKISVRNGRVQFLSELAPVEVEETPFFDRVIHWKANQSLTGSPLFIRKKLHRRGIAMHSRTKLSYDLAGRYDRFMATVALAPEMRELGNAAIQVIGDEQVLFEKAELAGDEVLDIDIEVSDFQVLTLVTDFGEGQDVGDRVHWGDARIVRQAK
ncbi:MAG: NPCBM/NEW2 domain-containing protein, partial [Planctomycetales bacterium]|nr:NPCBM/NEW2 domain-containing protein [Planctomycetales bacterium]